MLQLSKKIIQDNNQFDEEDADDNDIIDAENFKGIYYNENTETLFYEHGAHFPYKLLVKKLTKLSNIPEIRNRNSSYTSGLSKININTTGSGIGRAFEKPTNSINVFKSVNRNSQQVTLVNNIDNNLNSTTNPTTTIVNNNPKSRNNTNKKYDSLEKKNVTNFQSNINFNNKTSSNQVKMKEFRSSSNFNNEEKTSSINTNTIKVTKANNMSNNYLSNRTKISNNIKGSNLTQTKTNKSSLSKPHNSNNNATTNNSSNTNTNSNNLKKKEIQKTNIIVLNMKNLNRTRNNDFSKDKSIMSNPNSFAKSFNNGKGNNSTLSKLREVKKSLSKGKLKEQINEKAEDKSELKNSNTNFTNNTNSTNKTNIIKVITNMKYSKPSIINNIKKITSSSTNKANTNATSYNSKNSVSTSTKNKNKGSINVKSEFGYSRNTNISVDKSRNNNSSLKNSVSKNYTVYKKETGMIGNKSLSLPKDYNFTKTFALKAKNNNQIDKGKSGVNTLNSNSKSKVDSNIKMRLKSIENKTITNKSAILSLINNKNLTKQATNPIGNNNSNSISNSLNTKSLNQILLPKNNNIKNNLKTIAKKISINNNNELGNPHSINLVSGNNNTIPIIDKSDKIQEYQNKKIISDNENLKNHIFQELDQNKLINVNNIHQDKANEDFNTINSNSVNKGGYSEKEIVIERDLKGENNDQDYGSGKESLSKL